MSLKSFLNVFVCCVVLVSVAGCASSRPRWSPDFVLLEEMWPLRLPAIFGDHMVLQRGVEYPIWGWAAPGADVAIGIERHRVLVKADDAGKWRARMPELRMGETFDVTVSSLSDRIVMTDVILGDVWVGSGQSNMQWSVTRSANPEEEIAAADYPDIRLFHVERTFSETPLDDVVGSWSRCSPETVAGFSAVAYYFGRSLHKHLDVPIGLIHTSWGGTPAEAWTSHEALAAEPSLAYYLEREESRKLNDVKRVAEFEAKAAATGTTVTDATSITGLWDVLVREGDDVLQWTLSISNDDALNVDMSWTDTEATDVAFDNGTLTWSHRLPDYSAEPLVSEITFTDTSFKGSIGDGVYFRGVKRADGEEDAPEIFPSGVHRRSSGLYNGMIAPLVPYAMRGAIWYQGESNASRKEAPLYEELFGTMITDWRARWGQGDFPFLFVQLANYKERQESANAESSWARLRESQLKTLALPNTGMAVIIDIGEADDIHPQNKQDVGKRLARAALVKSYGEDVPYSGPIYRSHSVEDGKVRLEFAHTNNGIFARGGAKVQGFAVAGEDRKFVWADAKLFGDEVVVSSSEVPAPVAVRYGWGDNPVCNLFNGAGLPASPFRTDDWETGTD